MTHAKLEDLRILSIDDDPFILDVITTTLNHLGIARVETRTTAAAALDLIARDGESIDVVLCDLHMPDMDGIEFMSELVAREFNGCFAVVSGAGEVIVDMAKKLAGARGIRFLGSLQKPFRAKNLGDLLEKALS